MSTALAGIGATDVETDCKTKTCSFKVAKDVDVDMKLKELAEDASTKLADWTKM